PNACQPDQIRADLQAIASYTRAIRIYSATRGMELVPQIAQELGLKVSLGAWLGTDADRNEREIQSVIDLARKNLNIDSLVVGKETIYTNATIPVANLGLGSDKEQDSKDAEAALVHEETERLTEAHTDQEKQWAKDENNVQRLIRVIQRVRRETGLPVTT